MKSRLRFARATGFTVAELIIAIAIILIVAALAHPVVLRAGLRAKEAKCVTNLRQIHLAISLYRESYGGDGVYGPPTTMGLPPIHGLYPDWITTPQTFQCGLGSTREEPRAFTFMYLLSDPDHDPPREYERWVRMWTDYVQTYREESILLIDRNHDKDGRYNPSPYVTHKAIGIYLGGHVKTLVKQGEPQDLYWWNSD